MRRRLFPLLLGSAVLLLAGGVPVASAKDTKSPRPATRIIKVLPHFLDHQGRHTVNPSLFDRDAYQFDLRSNPSLRSGMRFDVLWKGARRQSSPDLTLRLELRGSKAPEQTPVVVTAPATRRRGFSDWTRIPVTGKDYENLGELVAWRVSLWNGDQQVAEQSSFLW